MERKVNSKMPGWRETNLTSTKPSSFHELTADSAKQYQPGSNKGPEDEILSIKVRWSGEGQHFLQF
jgi:hypothetical protein